MNALGMAYGSENVSLIWEGTWKRVQEGARYERGSSDLQIFKDKP